MAGAKTTRQYRERQQSHPIVSSILDAADIEYEDVDVPEWGVKVRVRGMDGEGRDAYEASLFALRQAGDSAQMEAKFGNRRARLLVRCLYDPDTDERLPISAEQLSRKSGAVLDRLSEVALRLSGMTARGRRDVEGN